MDHLPRTSGREEAIAAEYRKHSCLFLQQVGVTLHLPQATIATALFYFHQFFDLHDFSHFDRIFIAISCLFLAGKVEETPKKLKDVIFSSHKVIHDTFHPQQKYMQLTIESPEFLDFREKILFGESIVLQCISYDFVVNHPYQYLLQYLRKMNADKMVAQSAWNLVNDSLRTRLCLQYEPQKIACAALYMASKKRPSDVNFWKDFNPDVTLKDLEDISFQILELYSDQHPLKNELKQTTSPLSGKNGTQGSPKRQSGK
uniref:Cyclin-like domain-containing protein n=1 Tax=Arcella intermedia TaxID=1963864 RepID=A0A6B2LE09_9EUKA